MADDDYDGAPELQESDDEEEEVRVVQSKWLNDDGKHVLKHEHAGTYTPKGLITELNKKPGAVFLQYFEPVIVKDKGHAGYGACGLKCKAPGCPTILKPNATNVAVKQHGKTCSFWTAVKAKRTPLSPGEIIT